MIPPLIFIDVHWFSLFWPFWAFQPFWPEKKEVGCSLLVSWFATSGIASRLAPKGRNHTRQSRRGKWSHSTTPRLWNPTSHGASEAMKNGDFMILKNGLNRIEWEYHGDLPLWWFTLFKHQKDVENSWFSEENDLQMVSCPHHSTST